MLAHLGVSFESRDLFREPLSADELRGLRRLVPLEDLFSWRSPTARARGLTPETIDDDKAVALMAEEPRLIRRPLIRAGELLIIGADREAIDALVGSAH